jgi:sugar phosphate isomerase/epimerase
MAGMELIVGVPAHELLKYVEGKVKEYNIKVAIHNHGPGDKLYPGADEVYEKVKNLDKRIGMCVDIGHTKRIDRDPEADIRKYIDRVHDIHIKDVTMNKAEGKTIIIGRGIIDMVSFLNAMVEIGYDGTLALEYEADADDPLPGMMECFGYVKGILATM